MYILHIKIDAVPSYRFPVKDYTKITKKHGLTKLLTESYTPKSKLYPFTLKSNTIVHGSLSSIEFHT